MPSVDEDRPIVERILRIVRYLNNLLTLQFAIESLHNFRLWKARHRWIVRLLYGFVLAVCLAILAVGMKIYYAMLDGTVRKWKEAGMLMYVYHCSEQLSGSGSAKFVLACLPVTLSVMSVEHYTFFPFLRYYPQELADLARLSRQLTHFRLAPWRHYDKRIINRIASRTKVGFNRQMSFSERTTFVNGFARNFRSTYLIIFRCFIGVFSVSSLVMLNYLVFYFPFSSLLSASSVAALLFSVLFLFSLSLGSLLGFGLPLFIICFATLLIYSVTISWRQFCIIMRRIDASWYDKPKTGIRSNYDRGMTRFHPDYDSKFVSLFFHLYHGQRLYVNCLTVFQKINHCMLDKVFFVSSSLIFLSQAEMSVELFAGRLEPGIQSLITVLIIFELILVLSPVFILMMTSKQLFSVNPLLLSYYFRFARHRFRPQLRYFKTRAMLRWSLFGEVIHSRKRFAFCMSLGIGRINSMTIVKFVPIYSSFLFMLIPMVTMNVNSMTVIIFKYGK